MNQPVEPHFLSAELLETEDSGERHVGARRFGQVLLVSLVIAWLLWWYRDTALAMEAIWSRSGTFAHGYVVAPISIWLIWCKRGLLAKLPLKPSLLGLIAGLACGAAWVAAQLVSVDVVAQFALVGMVVSAVWALAGTAVVGALLFPLAFLLFCVPFGEFLLPTMMDYTARFVMLALRLTGVPVFVEGRSLVIPSGQWQVVEACSGIRYLIASVVVGSLYAYLNYRSAARRLIFVAVSLAVPILANWLRAYGIVMLGHLSGNRLATGVDHLIYGWLFFGVVMLGVFWIGARWHEPETQSVAHSEESESRAAPGPGIWLASAALVAIVLSLARPTIDWLDARGQHGPVVLQPMPPAAGWNPDTTTVLPDWSPHFGGTAAEARSLWRKNGVSVGVYVGYYRDQAPGHELVNSENKLVDSEDPMWRLAGYGDARVRLADGVTVVRSTELTGPKGRLLVWHWYWIDGKVTSSDYLAKLLLALAQLKGRGDDSAVVMIYTPAEGIRGSAEQALTDFAEEMVPVVHQTLATSLTSPSAADQAHAPAGAGSASFGR